MAYPLLRWAPLLLLLSLAAATDLRDRKIPNWLNALLILGGFAQSLFPAHLASPLHSMLGLFAGASIPFVLFAIGALGAGDVKLMAGVGAWLGPAPAFGVFVLAALIGMILVLAQAALHGKLPLLMGNSLVVATNLLHIRAVGAEHAIQTGRSARSVDRPLPYAVPVLSGVLFLLVCSLVWRR